MCSELPFESLTAWLHASLNIFIHSIQNKFELSFSPLCTASHSFAPTHFTLKRAEMEIRKLFNLQTMPSVNLIVLWKIIMKPAKYPMSDRERVKKFVYVCVYIYVYIY